MDQKWVQIIRNGSEMGPDYQKCVRYGLEIGPVPEMGQEWIRKGLNLQKWIKNGLEIGPDYQK